MTTRRIDPQVIDYESTVWREQCASFLREVGGCGVDGRRAVVAGNSIGGYVALSVGAEHPELVSGVASLNGAGKFSPTPEEAAAEAEEEARRATRGQFAIVLDDVKEAVSVAAGRAGAYAGLFVTKQPLRIKQILRQVRRTHLCSTQSLAVLTPVPARAPEPPSHTVDVNFL